MSDLVIWGNVAWWCGGVFLSGNWTVKILNLNFQKSHFKSSHLHFQLVYMVLMSFY